MAALSLLPDQLKSEMGVVKEERRLRVDDDIAGMLDEALYANAFFASTYHWPVLGWTGDLDRIAREECVDYFRTYYAPDNCTLVLCGDFDSATALAAIEKAFGPIPAQPPPSAPVDAEPEQRGERRIDVHYPAETESFDVGYKAPSAASADLPTLMILATLLSEGESSRLHQAMVMDHPIALSASAFMRAHLQPGLFELYVEMKPGHTAREGLAAMDSVLARLAREGPTERELEKAKNLREAEFVKALKTNRGAGEQLGFYEHVYGRFEAMFDAVAKMRAVTADDCRRVARRTFDANRRTVATLVPERRAQEAAR
jgi:predicted Zn-dependent peptidase